jgi:O-antigen/teichoic acid export membrane protein
MFPGLLGALVLGDRILQFYRPEFSQGTGILLILIAAYLVDVFAAQFTNVINGIDRPDVAFRVNIIFITMNATLNIILVWQYGWYGAAVATATSSALRAIAGYMMLERILGDLSIPLGEHARQVVAAVVMAAVVYLLIPYAPTGRPGTVLLVAVGAVIYGGVLFGIAPRVRKKALALKSQAV